jgi:hypothetical protein
MYSRQVCGLPETGWIVIWVRRFVCLVCGHTMSLLPDWLHPWRWYAAAVIIEALYRHCVLQESTTAVATRFGRPSGVAEWKSLHRWRKQLLISPTLWGWLGPRLGITKAAINREEATVHIERLLAEAGLVIGTDAPSSEAILTAVRKSLRALIHSRKKAWPMRHFLPGTSATDPPEAIRSDFPTQENSGPGPP